LNRRNQRAQSARSLESVRPQKHSVAPVARRQLCAFSSNYGIFAWNSIASILC
jgi:hypothetical protein